MRSRSYSTLGQTDEHMHNICIRSDEGAYGHVALMSLVMILTYLYTSSGYTAGLVTVFAEWLGIPESAVKEACDKAAEAYNRRLQR